MSSSTQDEKLEIGGVPVLVCAGEGTELKSVRDATDLIGDARSQSAQIVVVPISRFGDEFFDLKTRIAGEFLQKFVTYGLRIVLLGDLSELASKSVALRDFIRESNRGNSIWFLADLAELEHRLTADRR